MRMQKPNDSLAFDKKEVGTSLSKRKREGRKAEWRQGKVRHAFLVKCFARVGGWGKGEESLMKVRKVWNGCCGNGKGRWEWILVSASWIAIPLRLRPQILYDKYGILCQSYLGSTYQPEHGQRKDIHLGLSRAVISPGRYARREIGQDAEDDNNRDITQLSSKVPSFFFFFWGSYEKLYKGNFRSLPSGHYGGAALVAKSCLTLRAPCSPCP